MNGIGKPTSRDTPIYDRMLAPPFPATDWYMVKKIKGL